MGIGFRLRRRLEGGRRCGTSKELGNGHVNPISNRRTSSEWSFYMLTCFCHSLRRAARLQFPSKRPLFSFQISITLTAFSLHPFSTDDPNLIKAASSYDRQPPYDHRGPLLQQRCRPMPQLARRPGLVSGQPPTPGEPAAGAGPELQRGSTAAAAGPASDL